MNQFTQSTLLNEPLFNELYSMKQNYILYLPRSSSPRSSSHFRNSSLLTAGTGFADCLEFFRTSSSTKIGQSTRKASASASDGRESMLMTCPSLSSQIT